MIPEVIANKRPASLGDIQGWLEEGDPFFKHLEKIREENRKEKSVNPFRRAKRTK